MTDETNESTVRGVPRGRRFRTADALILVAAVAVGLAVSCWIEVQSLTLRSWTVSGSTLDWFREHVVHGPGSWHDSAEKASEQAIHLVDLSAPFLTTLSLALILVQSLPPRPRRLRLARRPGTAATRASVFALLYVVACFTIKRLASIPTNSRMDDVIRADHVVFAVNSLSVLAGLAIVSAWTTLLFARRWRAEPTWIDRLGRIVTVAWIAAGLFTICHYLVFRFLDSSASMMFWE